MNNESIVLQSAAPLDDGETGSSKICIICGGCGLVLGLLICIWAGNFNLYEILLLGILGGLGALIGWGIRNKKLRYKSAMLSRKRFMADEKPEYAELYQRLLPTFQALNLKMELNEKGIISVFHNGIYYDIVFNEDDSFSIHWHQSFLKELLASRFNISIYKKLVVSMGLIAYHVQRECLNDNEMYYTQEEK